jgi:hypothetical protein
MKKKSIYLMIIYAVLFIGLVLFTTLPNEYRTQTTEKHFVKIIDVDRVILFELFSDIEKYPLVLPENIISADIKSINKNIFIVEMVVHEAGIKIPLEVKHEIFPSSRHTITILTGDAKDTVLDIVFEDYESKTQLTVNMELHTKGILTPFGFLVSTEYQSAMNTVIESFIDYLNKINQI